MNDVEKAPYGYVALNGELRKVKAMYQTWGGNMVEFVPVVRCKDCVLHRNCLMEDTFNLCRIENPFCCAGKRKEGE